MTVDHPAPDTAIPTSEPSVAPGDAANARLDEAFAADPGPAPEPGQPPADPAEGDGDLLYRDAAALRAEIKASREKWKPVEQSFGQLDEQYRDIVLDGVAELGPQAAAALGILAQMPPDARLAILQGLDQLLVDPTAAAGTFRGWADTLSPAEQAAVVEQVQQQAAAVNETRAETGEQPLTIDDVNRLVEERLYEQQQVQEIENAASNILTHVNTLGYDLNSDDPAVRAEAAVLIEMAKGLPDGDPITRLGQAHAHLTARNDKIIASYLEGKRADAQRVTPAADIGTGPSNSRQPQSFDEAGTAAEARLDALFGNDPNSRR